MMTPEQAARASTKDVKPVLTGVDIWLAKASIPELLEYIHWLDPREAEHCFERARAELDARLADKAAEHARQMVSHTESLNTQTTTLVTESQKLGKLTWALIVLTVGLFLLTAGLLVIEWHRRQ